MSDFFRTVNWRTTGYAIAYGACYIMGVMFPSITDICGVLDVLIVSAGFVSSADSTRVQSIVRAVDAIAWRTKLDPAMLVPLELAPASITKDVP